MNLPTKYGVFAGLSIGVILFFFQLAGDDFNPGLKLAALLPLALFIIILFNKLKSINHPVFPEGVAKGIQLSAVAGIVVVLINTILFLVNKEYSFSKYAILPENIEYFATVSVILFFEILVAGLIIGFVAMQAMKGSSSTE